MLEIWKRYLNFFFNHLVIDKNAFNAFSINSFMRVPQMLDTENCCSLFPQRGKKIHKHWLQSLYYVWQLSRTIVSCRRIKPLYFVRKADIIIEKGFGIVTHTRRTLPCTYSHCWFHFIAVKIQLDTKTILTARCSTIDTKCSINVVNY